jgi:hypothetical protein
MKRNIIYYVMLVFALGLAGCNNRKPARDIAMPIVEEQHGYKFMAVLNSVSAKYPYKLKNEIQNERFCKELFQKIDSCLKKDDDFLSDAPVKLSYMSKKNGVYILSFECGSYTDRDYKFFSSASKAYAYFKVITEVPEDKAVELAERAYYFIHGTYIGGNNEGVLPSTGVGLRTETTCQKSPFGNDYSSVCLGGFVFLNVTIEPKN